MRTASEGIATFNLSIWTNKKGCGKRADPDEIPQNVWAGLTLFVINLAVLDTSAGSKQDLFKV